MPRKTEEAYGWGLRVGGVFPYLAYELSSRREEIEEHCVNRYCRPMRVVLLPEREFKRLKRLAKKWTDVMGEKK